MNWDRWGFTRRPFRAAPSIDLFVSISAHESVISELRSSYLSGAGIALLDGGSGSGKTLIALRLLDSLGSDVIPIFIPSSNFSSVFDFHRSILLDLSQDYRGLSDQDLRLSLVEYFLQSLAQRKRIVLVLDEAQHLNAAVLEEIRLLDNWDAGGTKAVFSLLVAQPELRERLARDEFESLAGRIGERSKLEALSMEDSQTLIRAQLESCSRRGESVFSAEAVECLAAHGRGNPRLLNRLCAAALEMASKLELEEVELEIAEEVLRDAGILKDSVQTTASSAPLAEPVNSNGHGSGEAGEGRESTKARPPKQKVRNRRAA